MNITLTPEAEKFIRSQIEAGHFATPEQLVEEAVNRLMIEQEDDLDDDTLAAIAEADAQIARGEGVDLETFKSQLRKRIAHAPR